MTFKKISFKLKDDRNWEQAKFHVEIYIKLLLTSFKIHYLKDCSGICGPHPQVPQLLGHLLLHHHSFISLCLLQKSWYFIHLAVNLWPLPGT